MKNSKLDKFTESLQKELFEDFFWDHREHEIPFRFEVINLKNSIQKVLSRHHLFLESKFKTKS